MNDHFFPIALSLVVVVLCVMAGFYFAIGFALRGGY